MKDYFKVPLTSLEAAHAYLRKLHEDGLLYHPDDDASTIVNRGGTHIFTAVESVHLNQRMAEVFSFDPDPCAFILDQLQGDEDASTP